MRIAMLAPPWIPVPPPGYGGIEAVVHALTEALVARGHHVTLYAPPGTRSSARVVRLLDSPHPDEIERAMHEADHVGAAFDAIEAEAVDGDGPFDVIHDHCGFVALAMAARVGPPLLHTVHGPFTPQMKRFYARHGHKGWVAGLSRCQLDHGPQGLRSVGAIPNPIDVTEWPLRANKQDYLLWVGRFSPEKGAHRAIVAARAADRPLVLAGVVQPHQREYFDREIAPHIDGSRVRYVGELGGNDKKRVFADATALLMPIRWPEPFGMVMVEAMVCGTPVIAFGEGAARELVTDGETGLLVDDEADMAAAVARIGEVDPVRCRATIAARCDAPVVARAYEAAYERVIRESASQRPAPRLRIGRLTLAPAPTVLGDPGDDSAGSPVPVTMSS